MVPGCNRHLSLFSNPAPTSPYSGFIFDLSFLAPTVLFHYLFSLSLAHPTWFPRRWPLTTLALRFLETTPPAGVMGDTYWDATSQHNYTKLGGGAEVVVSRPFQLEGQLVGILVCPSTPQGGVISQNIK